MPQDGNIIRATARTIWNSSGDDVQNVYYLEKLSGGTQSNLASAVQIAAIIDNMHFILRDQQSADLDSVDIVMRNLSLPTDLPTQLWPTYAGGLDIGQALPKQVAGLVSLDTTTPRKQGRKYIGGFVEGSYDGNGFVLSALTALVNYGAEFLLTHSDGTHIWQFVVLKLVGLIADKIDAAIIQAVPRTQRRRTEGFGS